MFSYYKCKRLRLIIIIIAINKRNIIAIKVYCILKAKIILIKREGNCVKTK